VRLGAGTPTALEELMMRKVGYRLLAGQVVLIALVASGCSATESPRRTSPTPTEGSTVAVHSTSSVSISGGSAASVVTTTNGSGTVVVVVDGKECRVDVRDAVAVRTVSSNGKAYVEITDSKGVTRRVDCP
jgi:hypothetical protein